MDLELKIDSGRFDLECIDKLMQLYSVSILKNSYKFFFWKVSSRILFGNEWWEIHVFYRAYSKHIAKAWSAKTYVKCKYIWLRKEKWVLEAIRGKKIKGERIKSWWINENQIIRAWREKKIENRLASWTLEEWS